MKHASQFFVGLKCKVLKHKIQNSKCPVTGIVVVRCLDCPEKNDKSNMSFR